YGGAQADTIFGVYAGGGTQNFDFTGDFEDTDFSSVVGDIDLEDDLNYDNSSGTYVYIAIEHPVPFLPNVLLTSTELDQSESSVITRTISFDNQTFTAGTAVDSTVDLSHVDATLYYELLDNWVNLDLGLTIRKFDGEIKLVSGTDNAQEDIDFTIPLLYGKARFDLPLTGVYVSASGNWIGVGSNNFLDSMVTIGYESTIGLGLEAGYRNITLSIDEDDFEADLGFSGIFAAATFHF
ncbi:MAG: TIGR04219 family outer membrane beta-barrel protein, partial [Pseudomonadales bacterium]|nr:TIGR04219 family outer membrane beta-barrel protein [Pseudomonadales bacterium]